MSKKNKGTAIQYDELHSSLMDMISSGEMHSTLIGKVISISGPGENLDDIENFVEYVVNLLKKAEQFRKDNVKKSLN
jgi:hypothetical protein